MLELNAPPIKTSFCRWDEPQSLHVALRYHGRRWPLQQLFGERLVVEVTDSKRDPSPVHVMSLGGWDRFLRNVHDWQPDRRDFGRYRLGRLRFTRGEVQAFIKGVDAGDFYRALAAT